MIAWNISSTVELPVQLKLVSLNFFSDPVYEQP